MGRQSGEGGLVTQQGGVASRGAEMESTSPPRTSSRAEVQGNLTQAVLRFLPRQCYFLEVSALWITETNPPKLPRSRCSDLASSRSEGQSQGARWLQDKSTWVRAAAGGPVVWRGWVWEAGLPQAPGETHPLEAIQFPSSAMTETWVCILEVCKWGCSFDYGLSVLIYKTGAYSLDRAAVRSSGCNVYGSCTQTQNPGPGMGSGD